MAMNVKAMSPVEGKNRTWEVKKHVVEGFFADELHGFQVGNEAKVYIKVSSEYRHRLENERANLMVVNNSEALLTSGSGSNVGALK